MKLSDFGLCKLLDSTNLQEKDFTVANNLSRALQSDGRPAIPKKTQQEQLLHWQRNRRMLAYSIAGTPDYIAPEVLLMKGYGMECIGLYPTRPEPSNFIRTQNPIRTRKLFHTHDPNIHGLTRRQSV
ncbi:putative non-specific serine/threonine protein kinase [Helianthus annuus]|nr:putative non-specific serine/threonine protein kinase [Helianthus annuus]KAJ0499422.1 putative non-specific serine/threonine protein kinase [Helianthus annuus]KAJ0665442.1 putative non-specific serine/threonine protein kinase [Helianthus annuus]